ncbi:MAG: cysteine protease [Gammaproteobacteria bacterium SG8_15]|nr:MAG: cysteine protease [Gammaproteobacteria bacterium SG8_15]
MQRLSISHLTEYLFAQPVTLEPHRLFLRPREGHDVRITSSTLSISPTYKTKWHRDVYDNSVAVVTFEEPADRLSILSEVVIEHFEDAPLDFVVRDYAVNYPFDYRKSVQLDLAPYLQPVYPADETAIRDWIRFLNLECNSGTFIETYVLLDRINNTIANDFQYIVREEVGVQTPAQTLRDRRGSCRDFAALFMETCRHLHLACRFVSGYLHAPATEAGNGTTHAWAEVYLPGPGWKGFDSTSGQVTGTQHIAVAVARQPEAVPPVSGSFIGPAGTRPTLTVNVRVNAV